MIQTVFSFILICLSTSLPLDARADLSIKQQEFLQDFLGISKSKSHETFHEEPTSDDSRFGEVSTESPKTLYLNYNLFSKYKDSGIRLEGTQIHEAIHLHFGISGKSGDRWIEEGIASLGEYLYDLDRFKAEPTLISFLPSVDAYFKSPARSLETFQDPADYGKSLLFFLFLYETFHQTDFVHAYVKHHDYNWESILNATYDTPTSHLTPNTWKDKRVLIAQFYWSLVNKRNTLSTSVNDLFSVLLQNYAHELKPANWSAENLVSSHGFLLMKRSETCVQGTYTSPQNTLLYAVDRQGEAPQKRLMNLQAFDLKASEDTLFIINLEDKDAQINFQCQ